MNYHPRNRSRSTFSKPILTLLGVFILGVIGLTFLDGVIMTALSPIWKAENAATAKLSGIGDFFRTRNSLIKENNLLKERLSALENEMSTRLSVKDQEAFYELLGRRVDTSGGVVASALITPPQTPFDTLVIDAGVREGLNIGDRIFLSQGPLVGSVVEVFNRTAKVKLFSSPGIKTNAILERNGVPVVLEGIGSGNFKIILSREVEIERGDKILTTEVFPNLLAVVGDIKVESTDAFKEVLASGPVNIFSIHLVLVRP